MVSMLIGDSSDRGSRHPAPASAQLWSRIAEQEFRHKLHDTEKHLVALVEMHQDIAAHVSEDMHEAVRTATTGSELRQTVNAPFSAILSAALSDQRS
ncbi:hypothetical protein JG687_00012676 [Phytophthora cactorum]|uniref:Uncharacterized protein n=1 Tax=Phytophthora cactorum TaxID=29920 RepID=A0A8T1U2D6_9STRA|nr:hypothetical protein JG687_00012676 [Phytophthora cactorum]